MSFNKGSLKYLGGLIAPKVASYDVTSLPSAYPIGGQNADALNFGGRPFAIDLERREFVLGTRYGRVCRLQMVEPAPHTDTQNSFPTAPYVLDTMVEVSGPSGVEDPPTPDTSWFEMNDQHDPTNCSLGGLLPFGVDALLAAGQMYYDANGTQRRCAFLADWPSEKPASSYHPRRTAFRTLECPYGQGMIAGYFTPVPDRHQDALKGDTLMGQASLPIISRGSAGPCAASFWAEDVLECESVPTTLLVGYPQGHWMPGHPWDNPNADDVYNFATQITGMAILGDTIVFVGSHGYGTPCYGDGVSDPALADGVHTCYDPTTSAKANHAYPYRTQLWFYPVADLAAVAAGEKEPWSMVPDWFELDLPFTHPNEMLQGCAFDPTTNRFWVVAYGADGYGYEPGPILYGFEYVGDDVDPPDPPTDQEERIKQLLKLSLALLWALKTQQRAHTETLAAIETDATHILSLTNPDHG